MACLCVRGLSPCVFADESPFPMDCTFVVRDVGDAQFLSEAARELSARGRRVGWVALGQGANALLQSDSILQKLALPVDALGEHTHLGAAPNAFGGGRAYRVGFAAGDAERLAKRLAAPVVVTGVVSRAQQELACALRAQTQAGHVPYLVGVYDSLALNKHCFLFDGEERDIPLATKLGAKSAGFCALRGPKAALAGATPSFAAQLDELWVPLSGLKAGVGQLAHLRAERIQAVGHPPSARVLERLAAKESQREVLRAWLGLNSCDQLIFYAGERDMHREHHAARSLELLLRGAQLAPAPSKGRRMIVVGLHPASCGQIERDLLMLIDPPIEVRIVRTVPNDPVERSTGMAGPARAFSTEELIVAADVVASLNSTVASQAALYNLSAPLPRKVLFVDANPQRDGLLVVEEGLATHEATIQSVARSLAPSSAGRAQVRASGAAAAMLVDLQASSRLADRLEALLPLPAPAL